MAHRLPQLRARRSWSVLLIIALSSVFPSFRAQRPDFEAPEFAKNRLYHKSSDAPIAKFLNDYPAVASSTRVILDHIAHVEDSVVRTLRERSIPRPLDLHVCRSGDSSIWLASTVNHFGSRGWAEPPQDCVSDLHGMRTKADEEPRVSLDKLYDAVFTRGETINRLARNISDKVLGGEWTDPELVYNVPYSWLSQRCVVHPIAASRVGGKWRLLTSITNKPKDQQLPDRERQFLIEYLRVDDDGAFVDSAKMRLPTQPDEGSVIVENTTTSLGFWRGGASPSFYGNTYPEENPAVLDALDGTDLAVQQADDAMTLSGIAILALPILLNAVPVSLIADVSSLTTFVYVVLSDVVTTIPLFIKGVELIIIGRTFVRSVVTRVSSTLDGAESETAAAEMFVAGCGANRGVLTTGIVFVVLAIAFMIGGVIAELASRRYVKNRRRRRQKKRVEPKLDPAESSQDFVRNDSTDGAGSELASVTTGMGKGD